MNYRLPFLRHLRDLRDLHHLRDLRYLRGIRTASLAGSAAVVLGALALVTVSCAAPEYAGRPPGVAGATVVFPGLRGLLSLQTQTQPHTVTSRPAASVPATASPEPVIELVVEPTIEPVIEPTTLAPVIAPVIVLEPAAEPAPEPMPVPAAPTPEPIGPLPGGTAFIASVERWRPLVRELIAEAHAEGRLQGHAGRIDEDLVLAVMEQESGGDPDAMSWAGARGLMQLMPASFAWIMGIADWGQDISHMDPNFIFDPSTNLRAGIRFLGAVLEEQSGSVYWALASYNAGGGNVNRWRWAGLTEIPATYGGGETANYVPAILGNYNAHRPA
jgi:soluble lytic murein transglycosylase-like protein